MNIDKKITLTILLACLSAYTYAAQSPVDLAKYHEEQTEVPKKIAEVSFTWLFTNCWFEMLFKELDKKDHVPASWKFARRINKPMIGITGLALIGASSTWFYNACLAEYYKEELLKKKI